MQVRTEDLVAFYKDRIVKTNLKIEKLQQEYKVSETAYENKFFPKLFGWKYKDASSSCYDETDINWYKRGVKSYEAILVKLEYCTKMAFVLMDIDENHEDSFFKFAKENSLPY